MFLLLSPGLIVLLFTETEVNLSLVNETGTTLMNDVTHI